MMENNTAIQAIKAYRETKTKVESGINVGQYHIKKHEPIPNTDQKHVIWITNKAGEGMGVDIHKLWEERF